MIETPDGMRPVEGLSQGDMVMTRDDGPQPLRWIGQRTVPAVGKMAPVSIAANALGLHGALKVSPLHRIMVKDALAELLFGEDEVLIAAKDLVNDKTIRAVEGGEVDYVHLMFDRHQVIYSEGLATESFLPGPQTTESFEAEIVEEICTIFPELDAMTGEGYGPAARPLLNALRPKPYAGASRETLHMTPNWIGTRTHEGGVFNPAGLGCARRPDPIGLELLTRGSVFIETTTRPRRRPVNLLRFSALDPWPSGLTVCLEADGTVRLLMRQGTRHLETALKTTLGTKVQTAHISYVWDAPARRGQLSVHVPDTGMMWQTEVIMPFPLSMRDARRMMMDKGTSTMEAGVVFAAIADAPCPLGPLPGLAGSAAVETPHGPNRSVTSIRAIWCACKTQRGAGLMDDPRNHAGAWAICTYDIAPPLYGALGRSGYSTGSARLPIGIRS